MLALSTSRFRTSFKRICKKPKEGYSSCPSDICDELLNKRVEDLIVTNNAVLRVFESYLMLKIRLPCKSNRNSKSGGFRLIAFINKGRQEITFLEIYPKDGPLKSVDITEEGEDLLLDEFAEETEAGLLIQHNLNRELAEINPEEDSEEKQTKPDHN